MFALSVASRSGRRGVKMGKQPTVRYELPELRIHRSVSPVDCLCNGTCRVKPCAERHRRSCHRGAAHGAYGCLRCTWSALRAASEDETGEPLTRLIEADVLPTCPGRGDACGAHGGL